MGGRGGGERVEGVWSGARYRALQSDRHSVLTIMLESFQIEVEITKRGHRSEFLHGNGNVTKKSQAGKLRCKSRDSLWNTMLVGESFPINTCR